MSLDLRYEVDDGPADPGQPSPEAASIELEQQAEVLAAVNMLRPEDRLVIAYRYWLEMPEAEMADALGCARGTVKSRLSRATGRLRARMPESLVADRGPREVTSGG